MRLGQPMLVLRGIGAGENLRLAPRLAHPQDVAIQVCARQREDDALDGTPGAAGEEALSREHFEEHDTE
jgi:hypothetical protein